MTVAHMTINPVGHCPIPAKDINQKHDPSLLDLLLVKMADFNVSYGRWLITELLPLIPSDSESTKG